MTALPAGLFGFDFRPLAPEARRLMWELRASGGGWYLNRFASRTYTARLGAALRCRGFARFVGGGGNKRLELTERGQAYLDRIARCE